MRLNDAYMPASMSIFPSYVVVERLIYEVLASCLVSSVPASHLRGPSSVLDPGKWFGSVWVGLTGMRAVD